MHGITIHENETMNLKPSVMVTCQGLKVEKGRENVIKLSSQIRGKIK